MIRNSQVIAKDAIYSWTEVSLLYSSSLHECVRLPTVLDCERLISDQYLRASCPDHNVSFTAAQHHADPTSRLCWQVTKEGAEVFLSLLDILPFSAISEGHNKQEAPFTCISHNTQWRIWHDTQSFAYETLGTEHSGCKHQPKSAWFFLESRVAYLSFKEAKKNIASLTVSFKL